MPTNVHSMSGALEVRERCRKITETAPPGAVLEKLLEVEQELAFPERGEAWEAIASLRTPEAAMALRHVLERLSTRPERKRMRTILHHLRSRGIPEAEASAPPGTAEARSGRSGGGEPESTMPATDRPELENFLLEQWKKLGWRMIAAETHPVDRFRAMETALGLWIARHEVKRLNPERAARRLWGKGWEAFLDTSTLPESDLEQMLLHYELWDFRVTYRSKTLAERVFEATAKDVPLEVRAPWQARIQAVTSIFAVTGSERGSARRSDVVDVEDVIVGGRAEARIAFVWDKEPSGQLIAGKVFEFEGHLWLAPWCRPMQPLLGWKVADHVEREWKRARALRPIGGRLPELSATEFLRGNPEAVARGIRRGEERLAKEFGPLAKLGDPEVPDHADVYRPHLTFDRVLQFRISLDGVHPEIWRRIQVPDTATLWDLHVAIQDSMGWEDSHLHVFELVDPRTGRREQRGIPNEEDRFEDEELVQAGWKARVARFFTPENRVASYVYDLGDDWRHTVELEKILDPEEDAAYPRCVDGARACPPEDCGGPGGYEQMLAILGDPGHEEHDDTRTWAGDFDPERFDPGSVRFEDPGERWELAFLEDPGIE